MTEVFESAFHKRYVGGEGEVRQPELAEYASPWERNVLPSTTLEDILEEYRWYMRDQNAELPEELKKHLLTIGIRTENAKG